MLVIELWPALLALEVLVADEDDEGDVEVFVTLNDVNEGDEEKPVDGADDVRALEVGGGWKLEARVDPCEIGGTGVASDEVADTELLLTPPS